jgi:Vitamin B6 photo-protection and homoeostasis
MIPLKRLNLHNFSLITSCRCVSFQPASNLLINTKQNEPSTSIVNFKNVSSYIKSKPAELIQYFLPAGYPITVAPCYKKYALWNTLGSIASATGGVLSMQALLYAVGLGSGSIPLAAALNWVIKDGIGQIGGVLYAAWINNRFDSELKRWRMMSSIVSDVATFVEVCTPFFPSLFLPLAALANVGKNVAWLSASATRAGIHQTLGLHGNLADVTAKAGSQTIAASSIGTLLGVLISPYLNHDVSMLVYVFSACSAVHLLSVYASLKSVELPTLNRERMALALEDAVALISSSSETRVNSTLNLKTPAQVSLEDPILAFSSKIVEGLRAPDASRSSVRILAKVSPNLASMSNLADTWYDEESLREHQYSLLIPSSFSLDRAEITISLVYSKSTSWKSTLVGYFHLLLYQQLVRSDTSLTTVDLSVDEKKRRLLDTYYLSKSLCDRYSEEIIQGLDKQGWWVGTPLIERDISLRI